MKTTHRIFFANAKRMDDIPSNSIGLVVTSPPYPMIEMWDEVFERQHSSVCKALIRKNGIQSFENMHKVLDPVWAEVHRVLLPGGFACINIGDATRTVREHFALYPNHMRILKTAVELGFTVLPCILWRKQTNAPNKFMGSGMLPAGAYVTLEHEYILVLRKGGKRIFRRQSEKENRHESALFWEERNRWFSDVWFDVKGTPQALNDKDARKRSGAFPFALAYRLINMYSVKHDTVLDPFLGTGTTTAAAAAAGRSSIGYEIDTAFKTLVAGIGDVVVDVSRRVITRRLSAHMDFVAARREAGGSFKHCNRHYGFPVITAQEKNLLLNDPLQVEVRDGRTFAVVYSRRPQPEFCNHPDESAGA